MSRADGLQPSSSAHNLPSHIPPEMAAMRSERMVKIADGFTCGQPGVQFSMPAGAGPDDCVANCTARGSWYAVHTSSAGSTGSAGSTDSAGSAGSTGGTGSIDGSEAIQGSGDVVSTCSCAAATECANRSSTAGASIYAYTVPLDDVPLEHDCNLAGSWSSSSSAEACKAACQASGSWYALFRTADARCKCAAPTECDQRTTDRTIALYGVLLTQGVSDEGTLELPVPLADLPAGTVLTASSFTGRLELGARGDQLTAFSGNSSSPTFACAIHVNQLARTLDECQTLCTAAGYCCSADVTIGSAPAPRTTRIARIPPFPRPSAERLHLGATAITQPDGAFTHSRDGAFTGTTSGSRACRRA